MLLLLLPLLAHRCTAAAGATSRESPRTPHVPQSRTRVASAVLVQPGVKGRIAKSSIAMRMHHLQLRMRPAHAL